METIRTKTIALFACLFVLFANSVQAQRMNSFQQHQDRLTTLQTGASSSSITPLIYDTNGKKALLTEILKNGKTILTQTYDDNGYLTGLVASKTNMIFDGLTGYSKSGDIEHELRYELNAEGLFSSSFSYSTNTHSSGLEIDTTQCEIVYNNRQITKIIFTETQDDRGTFYDSKGEISVSWGNDNMTKIVLEGTTIITKDGNTYDYRVKETYNIYYGSQENPLKQIPYNLGQILKVGQFGLMGLAGKGPVNLPTGYSYSKYTYDGRTGKSDEKNGEVKLSFTVNDNGTIATENNFSFQYESLGSGGNDDNKKEAYAVLSPDNSTLTFYFDNQKASRNGSIYEIKKQETYFSWNKSDITKVIFDTSFAKYDELETTANWFAGYNNLRVIEGLGYGLNTSNVKYMSDMFRECSSLVSLDLSGLNTSNVTSMQSMFDGCTSLTSLNLTNLDTSSVTDLDHMFNDCSSLTSLDLSIFDTSNVTSMYSMFEGCSSLKCLYLSGLNTSNVTKMKGMFVDCSSLTSLDLSNFDTRNVTTMSFLFYGCSALKTIYVSNLWSTEKVSESKQMFSECTNLIGGDGTKFDPNYTDKTKAYAGPGGYLTMEGQESGDELDAYAVLSNDNTTLTFYYDNKKNSRNGMEIGPFEDSKQRGWDDYADIISTVVFDSSFEDMANVTSTAYWFKDCRKLNSISGIEHLKTDNVVNMTSMFANCKSLPNIDFSTFNTSNVQSMADMFEDCHALTNLDLSSFKTGNVKDMSFMFVGCKNLESLNLSSFDTEHVTTMLSMFENCEKLSSLNISSFNTTNVTRMEYMFDSCESLTKLDLGSFNTTNVENMVFMFGACRLLTTIDIGSQWTTENVSKSDNMFYDCTNLIGGDGTKFDPNYTDKAKAYAGPGGYLTMEGQEIGGEPEAYAVLNNDNTTLTFYYDGNKDNHEGIIYTSSDFRKGQDDSWGEFCEQIKDVNFDKSFISYEGLESTAYWFRGCSNMRQVSGLEYLNTSNVKTMALMFSMCRALESLNVGHFDTSNVQNMNQMFDRCTSLEHLDLSSFNTSNVTQMVAMFQSLQCTSINLSNFDTSNVTDMSWMFANCDKLEELDLSNFETSKVTNMDSMIRACRSLKKLDISSFDTSNVTSMESMFRADTEMLSLDLSHFNTKNVTDFAALICDCYKLQNVKLDNLDTSNATDMSWMFANCYELTILNLESFKTSNLQLTKEMFSGCKALHTITIKNEWTTNKVTDSSDMFKDCNSLVGGDGTVYDPNYTDKTKAYAGPGGYLTMVGQESGGGLEAYAVLSNDNTTLTFYYDVNKNLREGTVYTKLNRMYDSEWYGKGFTKVVFDQSFADYDGLTNLSYWFCKCGSLQTIEGMEYLNTENVTDMSYMFAACSSLTDFDLSSLNTSNVTNMADMFGGCGKLTTLDLNSFDTRNVVFMRSMFARCGSLKSFDMSNFDTSNVTDMEGMFDSCSNLTTIQISKLWNTDKVTKSERMFDDCTNLVGGDGTKFDPNYTDKTKAYAGPGGYLTMKGGESEPNEPDDLQDWLDQLSKVGDKGTEENPVGLNVPDSGLDVTGDVDITDDLQAMLDGLAGKDEGQTETPVIRMRTGSRIRIMRGSSLTVRNLTFEGTEEDQYIEVNGTLILDANVSIRQFRCFVHVQKGGRVVWREGNAEASEEVIYNGGGGSVECYGGTLTGGIKNYGFLTIEGGHIYSGQGKNGETPHAIYNYGGSSLTISDGQIGENGTGSIWSEEDFWINGNVSLKDIHIKRGVRIHVFGKMTVVWHIHFFIPDEFSVFVPIVEGDGGYQLTEEDFGYLQTELPDSYEWRYNYNEYTAFIWSKGDANGDCRLNAADIVELVNCIMGKPSSAFDASAADVNGDGVVNAADIVGIVNIIMKL